MIDKVVKMTIRANSIEEAVEQAKSEKGVKNVLQAEYATTLYEVIVTQESYGEYGLGYCQECGDDLCCTAEFIAEMCDGCMYPAPSEKEFKWSGPETDELPF